jgi:hypothetical protein
VWIAAQVRLEAETGRAIRTREILRTHVPKRRFLMPFTRACAKRERWSHYWEKSMPFSYTLATPLVTLGMGPLRRVEGLRPQMWYDENAVKDGFYGE